MAERAAAHLAVCRSCMAAYAEAVRYRAAWLANPGAFEQSASISRRDMDVIAPARRHAAFPRLALGTATVALVAVAGIVTWRLQSAEPPALRAALERESSWSLVLPGGERGADRQAPVRRGPTTDAAVLPAVERAAQRYESGDRSADAAYRIAAGYMLTGNLEAARDYLDEGLGANPGDRKLGILNAALLYRTSDLERAERALREVLRQSPGDATAALDLAIVLEERGARVEARALLEALIAREPGSPLARRAANVLGNAGAR